MRARSLSRHQLRILVADDDEVIAYLVAELLASMGHHVCAVETTVPGVVQGALRERPDLMIVDARLADGNGPSAVAGVQRHLQIPHFYISGGIVSEVGSAIVLQKPFREADLGSAIARTLEMVSDVEKRRPDGKCARSLVTRRSP